MLLSQAQVLAATALLVVVGVQFGAPDLSGVAFLAVFLER